MITVPFPVSHHQGTAGNDHHALPDIFHSQVPVKGFITSLMKVHVESLITYIVGTGT